MAHHELEPRVYYTTIGPHDPVLTVAPGDTVATRTADARGYDRHDAKVADRGNPMTGPFFVTGAEPGDALAVTFESVRPNRRHGFTSPRIAPAVLDPGFPVAPEDGVDLCTWRIDTDALSAVMTRPASRLAGMRVPLEPMLGCFGVAPPRGQAISTATSGTHGGNMDYRGFRAGSTVYLPVAVEGALFFLGDGHAAQGDGEIVGTGIEVSMDVTFRVEVRKAWTIGWPRGESASHVFTVGNARPLDQAVQHATTEMVRWLEGDFLFSTLEAHSLLGQCVEYEIGNVFDPAYTVVCKLSRNFLE